MNVRNIKTDVLVIGGGTAGVFAAIASARCGAKTMLIEKNSILGGTITVAGINFPGLFFAWGKQIIAGPCWEAIERCVELGGAVVPEIPYRPEKHWEQQISLNRFIYTSILFEMCDECGVELLTNAMVASVEETENGIKSIITDKAGMICVEAKTLIDATGDANAVKLAGYALEKSDTQQPATLENHISGYDFEKIDVEQVKQFFKDAGFPEYMKVEDFIRYLEVGKIHVHIPCENADTSLGRTALEKKAYATLMKIYLFYRKIRGLENLCIDFVAEETGVRESNRIVGEHKITAEEYIGGVMYDDSVCYAFYPIDLHVMDGIKMIYHSDEIVPKVPYRSLMPKGGRHILCAGRCISSDTDANSALRVQATCMATGQATGCAAALASRNNIDVSDVNFEKLKEALRSIGAIVPEK